MVAELPRQFLISVPRNSTVRALVSCHRLQQSMASSLERHHMPPKCTLVYISHSAVCFFVPQPVIVDSHWLFAEACSVPEHPSQSHPPCKRHGARGLCSGQENATWIHIGKFCDLWNKMSAWRVSLAAPSTEYWSVYWSGTNSPTLTTINFCSFSRSCFPSSTQPAFSCLRQTHIPLPKVCFGQRPDPEAGCLPRWETASLVPGHWDETVQTSALRQAVPAPGSRLCSVPLLVTSCLPLLSSACSSHNLFSITSKENSYVQTSCKPDVPHWLPGEMC